MMLTAGQVISNSYFPEAVEIKTCKSIADFILIEAVGRETKHFYELMIEKEKMKDFQEVSERRIGTPFEDEDLQKYIQYKVLNNEVRFSNAKALGNDKVIPLPHQIEAVYGRMLQVPQARFLLADDPGAGKTIMAGMLIKELIARFQTERILILVPPLVLKQWQEELEQKFGLHFHIVNRTVLNEYGRKNPFMENNYILTSMHWAVRDDIRPLIQEANYDLIIVDEAHKMAAYTQGNAKKKVHRTKLYQLGERILHKSEHALLLTATPHKGDTENFRHLMRLIDEDVFSSSTANESLREKSNPFIIRRLKENLVNFDSTPIFPKRTTTTIQFELSEEELDLYDAVTEYVREYFNKAINKGNQSTAFAMMLLQRRLSSSIDAIYLSLQRRYKRLVNLYEETDAERKKYLRKVKKIDTENYMEESNEYQEALEKELELSIAEIDMTELKRELLVLEGLIKQAERIKLYEVERKYEELEETLFGLNGILEQNEKIIIFTEAVDTLNYLEEKLSKRISNITKIVGGLSMERRREQVELFRKDSQIMLTTDAGGESINLQFCNQMINYDIPWNPNKLEQRMGRIHRIGQKNEVFVFNLVAKNTREGSVMVKLLDKMEQMRADLGSDLVYDFIGEILEDNYDSLSDLMQQAIIDREHLDEIIENMDKTLSTEHEKLIDLVKEERVTEDTIDIPTLKNQQDDWLINRVPLRAYTDFTTYVLERKRVRIRKSKDGKIYRIERLPKFIRDQMPELNDNQSESYRFTKHLETVTEDVSLVNDLHPLFNISMDLMKQEADLHSLEHCEVFSNIPENLNVEIYEVGIVDGTGKQLENRMIHLAKRESGDIISLESNWIFNYQFNNVRVIKKHENVNNYFSEALQKSIEIRDIMHGKRELQLNKLHTFLEKSFNGQYRETLERLNQYQQEDIDNRNRILVNQMNAKLMDIDNKKAERLGLINRQKNVSIMPPKKIISLSITSNVNSHRVIASDYKKMIVDYEKDHGRMNVKQYGNLGIIDFSSERFNGEKRYILLTDDSDFILSAVEKEDLEGIIDSVYIYRVKNGLIIDEYKLLQSH